MFYSALLFLHIIGACGMAVAACYTIFALIARREHRYRRCASLLNVIVAFEICSGLLLAVVGINISMPLVCRDLAVYFLAWFVLEALLYARAHASRGILGTGKKAGYVRAFLYPKS